MRSEENGDIVRENDEVYPRVENCTCSGIWMLSNKSDVSLCKLSRTGRMKCLVIGDKRHADVDVACKATAPVRTDFPNKEN